MELKKQKVAVIAGATGGIGREVAALFLEAGMTLYLLGRNFDALRSYLDMSGNLDNKNVNFCTVDLNKEDAINDAIELIDEANIDFFIYCAAYYSHSAIKNADISDLDRSYRVNMRAPYLLTQKLLPKLIAGNGVIAFLNSSVVISSDKDSLLHYASTKSGLKTMADCLRREVNNMGVRVVTFILGKVATSMQQKACEYQGIPYKPDKMIQPKQAAKFIYQTVSAPDSMEVTDVYIRPSVSYN